MKEHPILFTPENVRAILDGRKTKTRRIVKPQPPCECEYVMNGAQSHALCRSIYNFNQWVPPTPQSTDHRLPCRYGQPGDRLWVRETWAVDRCYDHMKPSAIPASRPAYYYHTKPNHIVENWHKKRPSIFMPRWACRLWLELTEVRVERLQEISQADAIAEGAPPSHPSIDVVSREFGYPDFSRSWYAQLWERINGDGSWAANPYVWVLTFAPLDSSS